MRVRILPYKPGSQSARVLAESLGGKRIRTGNSRFRGRPNDVVINWGCTDFDYPAHNLNLQQVVNWTLPVAQASNKMRFFHRITAWNAEAIDLDQVNIPDWTDNSNLAQDWIENGHTVIARTMLRASGGRGIYVLNRDSEFVDAPLYTKYLKKRDEYRVHIANGRIFHIQQKRRRRDDENVNNQVRNHDNGWVFTIQNVDAPECVQHQAIRTFIASGLDFGAVDIIYNAHFDRATVLEINTAPGLEGTTYERYVDVFRNYIQEMRNE